MPRFYAPGERKGNRTYVVRGSVNGRQREKVTSATNARDARAAWRNFVAITMQQEPEKRDAASYSSMTFRNAAKRYLEASDRGANTEHYLDRLCARIGDTPVDQVNQDHLVTAAQDLYPGTKSATKNRQALGPAAAVLHYAAENGWRGWVRVRKFKEPKPTARALTEASAKVLVAGAAEDGNAPLVLLLTLLFRHGLRISDALALTWGDIDLGAGSVRYHVSKTDEWRHIPLHRDVLNLLKGCPGARQVGRLFPWRTRWGVYRQLGPLTKRLRISFTPHQARHSFATWLVNRGVSLPELMEAGGWADPKSVMRYGRVDQDRVRQVIHKVGD